MFDKLLANGFTVFAQTMVKIQPVWDRFKVLIGLVVGVLVGWFVLGWWLFPVQWSNATPGHLHERYKSAYLAYASEEFFRTNDADLLKTRLGLDLANYQGVRVSNIPWLADKELLAQDIQTALDNAAQDELESYVSPLTRLQQAVQGDELASAEQPSAPEVAPATEEAATSATPLARILRVVGILAVGLLVAGAAGVGWYMLVGKDREATPVTEGVTTADRNVAPVGVEEVTSEEEAPVKSFSTPYVLGDDYFDPSFSIEIGSDFLGECGIGISETLGAGDPKKVTAFEAWLFDKSDIRTVTKVLASEYAYDDADLMAKLEPKGDVVQMRPGEEIVLETTALRVKARIKELEYAQGANLPANSFVQKINFEIQAWVKQADEIVSV